MRRSAFTLMELLIVISIIMILMGMVFVGVRMARSAASKAKTTAALTSLMGALTNYRTMNGRYPDDPVVFTQFAGSPAYKTVAWADVNRSLTTLLLNAGEPLKPDPSGMLVDSWAQPFHYRPARFYPYTTSPTPEIDSDNPPNRDDYQLWSTGENKTDEGGSKALNTDDITSWAK